MQGLIVSAWFFCWSASLLVHKPEAGKLFAATLLSRAPTALRCTHCNASGALLAANN
jgi:hypothetical protein